MSPGVFLLFFSREQLVHLNELLRQEAIAEAVNIARVLCLERREDGFEFGLGVDKIGSVVAARVDAANRRPHRAVVGIRARLAFSFEEV